MTWEMFIVMDVNGHGFKDYLLGVLKIDRKS